MANIEFNSCINITHKEYNVLSNPSFCSHKLSFESKWFGIDNTTIALCTDYPSKLICYIDHKIGLDGIEE